jgi:elongation factor G
MKAIRWKDETMGADYVVEEIPADMADEAKAFREQLIEKVSEVDDKIPREIPPRPGDYGRGNQGGVTEAHRRVGPARKDGVRARHLRIGVQEQGRADAARRRRRLPAVAHRNSAGHRHRSRMVAEGATAERPAADDAPFAGLAFKIMTDPFVGQLTFIRVYSGVMTSGMAVYNAGKQKTERIGRLLKMHANKREDIKEVYAGDIAAAVGLKTVSTGDTVCDEKKPVVLEAMDFPRAGHLACD